MAVRAMSVSKNNFLMSKLKKIGGWMCHLDQVGSVIHRDFQRSRDGNDDDDDCLHYHLRHHC